MVAGSALGLRAIAFSFSPRFGVTSKRWMPIIYAGFTSFKFRGSLFLAAIGRE